MTSIQPPAPRETPVVFGHEAASAVFQSGLRAGRLHHAWLIHGPAGIGKASFAYQMARILLNAPFDSAAGRRVTAGTHADLMVISRSFDEKRGKLRNDILGDDIRPLHDFLHRTAAEGGWRVVIIDGAEYLNRSAANGLLKILEEPPERAILFLITSAPNALLPTIRSRCRALPLMPLNFKSFSQVSIFSGYSKENLPELFERSLGAPGRAMTMLDDAQERLAPVVSRLLESAAVSIDDVENIGRQENGFATLCDLLGEKLVTRSRHLARQDLVASARHAEAYASIAALRRETERFNLDKTQAVLQAAAIVSKL